MTRAFTHWGTYDLTVVDGRLVGVEAIAEDPDPSPIGQGLLDLADHPLRVRRPAVRRGFLDEVASGRRARRPSGRRRGAEPFVELPWDEAVDLVAAELQRVRTEHGNSSIYGGSYGWASAGRFHDAPIQLYRFLNVLGGFVSSRCSYSYAAAQVILPHVIADWFDLLGHHTSYEQLARHGRLVVALGGLPAKNQQVDYGGTYRHLAPAGIRRLRDAGIRLVNVSPLRDDLDEAHGARWIPIRPTTDTALLLGIAHTLVAEGLHDEAFLERYCSGVDRFLDSLAGHDAEWASAICAVPAEQIRALARDLAAGPSMLTAAWSLQRAEHGEQVYWAVVAVASLLGQIGTPGGGFGLGYGSSNRVGSSEGAQALARVPVGRNPVEAFIPVARVTDLLRSPGAPFTYDGVEYRYPDIRLVYWCGGNPFHHHQDLARLMQAWQKPESIFVHEQYWTSTAKRADVVLPATITLERNDIGYATREGHVVAMRKAVEPVGQARDDFAIFTALAERMGVKDAFTEGRDEMQWVEHLYDGLVKRGDSMGVALPDFATFWEQGLVSMEQHDKPVVFLEAFRNDPAANMLNTESGLIEIHSDRIAGFNLPDCPGHPTWMEPLEWLGGEGVEKFPLHLLSDQPARRLHSQLDASPHSLAGKVAGREPIYLNPDDAAARGIADGDVVEVFNDRGKCLAGAIVTPDIMPGVARLATGAWFDYDWQTGVEKHGNPNALTRDIGASGLSQGCTAQSCLVDVRPVDGPVPAVTAHALPDFAALR